MKEEDLNKIECLIGYIEYWCVNNTRKSPPSELPLVLEEAKEWFEGIQRD